MRKLDILRFARDAALGNPLRTLLSILAMAIGVAAVVLLTSLGDGARVYVVQQFSALGSNLVIILPGRTATGGFSPANTVTTTPRDLTVEDAQAIRHLPSVENAAPLVAGTSEINANGRLREALVLGTTASYRDIRGFKMALGHFLPEAEWNRGAPVAVIGAKIQEEIFAGRPAVGELIRLGDRRLRIVGVLKSSGQGLGMNTDELVFVPVSIGQAMFNTNTLYRILVAAKNRDQLDQIKLEAGALLKSRHGGEEDVTVITQDAVLATFDKLLRALTAAVAGIAAISLAVAGILVMNVMLVAVSQRTGEIGLLKALGARGETIRQAFLAEAAMLSLVGALSGYGLGLLGAFVLRHLYPTFPAYPPDWAVLAALATALSTGLLFGILPARRAAALDPVKALMKH